MWDGCRVCYTGTTVFIYTNHILYILYKQIVFNTTRIIIFECGQRRMDKDQSTILYSKVKQKRHYFMFVCINSSQHTAAVASSTTPTSENAIYIHEYVWVWSRGFARTYFAGTNLVGREPSARNELKSLSRFSDRYATARVCVCLSWANFKQKTKIRTNEIN